MPYDDTISTIRHALKHTFEEIDTWFDVNDGPLHFHAASTRWTIAEILEHISLTNKYLLIIIRRHADKAVTRAEAGEHVAAGESDLDAVDIIGQHHAFEWERPDHMEPTGKVPLGHVREKLNAQRKECRLLLEKMKLGEGSLVRVGMSVNGLGRIDMYQWLYFLVRHAARHVTQMELIRDEHSNGP